MSASGGTADRREVIETAALIAALALYITFEPEIHGRPALILPIVAACAGYALWAVCTGRATPAQLGLRADNLATATRAALRVYGPAAGAVLVWFAASPVPAPPADFYLTLAVYPFWGIAQQFVFQSLLHTRLIRLGTAPWSILITAAAYTAVHWHSPRLMAITFPAGLINGWLFLRRPNIIPLGIAHGVLGAMVYYLLFGEDPMARFLNG